jgi:hypothetical protein
MPDSSSYSLTPRDFSDQNNAWFSGQPDKFVFKNGSWQYRNSDGSTIPANPSNTNMGGNEPTHVGAQTVAGLPGDSGAQQIGGANVPGATLDMGQADAERARMQTLLSGLQSQAQTGNGAWQQALQTSTKQASDSAMGLGQSAPGQDQMNAGRSIGNAQAAVGQQAVGQANTLRAQTQQEAQSQIAGIEGQQAGTDAAQSAASAATRQGVHEAQNTLDQAHAHSYLQTLGTIGQGAATVASMLSKGGAVPGKPKTFGDSEKNDTVPAMLSPGEIVIPRTVAHAPDAPDQAARFVAAVKAKKGAPKHHFDDGGSVPDASGNITNAMGQLKNDPTVQAVPFNVTGSTETPASYDNGALLNTVGYNQSRDAVNANAGNFLAQYAGRGPTTSTQEAQTSNDTATAAALRARANSQGMGRGASMADSTMAGAAQAQQGAGQAATTMAKESTEGAAQFAKAIQQQRAQDLSLAQARQQAAWRNTMMNSGIGLDQQNSLRNLLSGAGQAVAAGTSAFGGGSGSGGGGSNSSIDAAFNSPASDPSINAAFNSTDAAPSASGDWNTGSVDSSGGMAAHGGVATDDPKRAASFLKALRARKAA